MSQRVAEEILATERKYVHQLRTIVHVFLEPLRERSRVSERTSSPCPAQIIPLIFANIDEILPVNEALLQDFENAAQSSDANENIGRVMQNYVS